MRSQRRILEALRKMAEGLGWSRLRRPFLSLSLTVAGEWNGRRVWLRYRPPSKNAPAFVAAEIALALPGRFELRGRPERDRLWNRAFVLFGPPAVELFVPADAARFRAWSADRTLLDRLLALPGIRPFLERNLLPGDGALTLRDGRLRVRRSPARTAGGWRLRFGSDPERVLEVAKEEWDLIAAASALA